MVYQCLIFSCSPSSCLYLCLRTRLVLVPILTYEYFSCLDCCDMVCDVFIEHASTAVLLIVLFVFAAFVSITTSSQLCDNPVYTRSSSTWQHASLRGVHVRHRSRAPIVQHQVAGCLLPRMYMTRHLKIVVSTCTRYIPWYIRSYLVHKTTTAAATRTSNTRWRCTRRRVCANTEYFFTAHHDAFYLSESIVKIKRQRACVKYTFFL